MLLGPSSSVGRAGTTLTFGYTQQPPGTTTEKEFKDILGVLSPEQREGALRLHKQNKADEEMRDELVREINRKITGRAREIIAMAKTNNKDVYYKTSDFNGKFLSVGSTPYGENGVMQYFISMKGRQSAIVVPILKVPQGIVVKADGTKGKPNEQYMVFVEQYPRFLNGQKVLTFPGGMLEAEENKKDGAGRELKEETGFEAKNIDLLGTTINDTQQLISYVATNLKETRVKDLDDYEKLIGLKRVFVPLNDVSAYLDKERENNTAIHNNVAIGLAGYIQYCNKRNGNKFIPKPQARKKPLKMAFSWPWRKT